MILIRRDQSWKKEDEWPDDLSQREFRIERDEEESLIADTTPIWVNFKRFGRGTERRSDFSVEVSWIDVRGFIRTFIEMGHPEALYLEQLIQLAQAIEKSGWTSNDSPPTEDFSRILPHSN
jgi:hypothetical protein